LVVAAPVLEFSPVLTDEDLLDIIAAGPCEGAIGAIARRKKVVEIVADAIVDTHDVDGIADLLANSTAQIREATLDRIVEEAPEMEAWHESLVRRSSLPPRVAPRLAMFVADNLLHSLTSRKDLDPETAEEVRIVVARRLSEGSNHESLGEADDQTNATPLKRVGKPMETPREIALRLHRADELDEKTITDAIIAKDQDFVVAALSQLSQLPRAIINKAFSTENSKGLISVTWKAGLSPSLAVELQKSFFHLPPPKVLGPRMDGDFPLGQDEMTWQLDFLRNL